MQSSSKSNYHTYTKAMLKHVERFNMSLMNDIFSLMTLKYFQTICSI